MKLSKAQAPPKCQENILRCNIQPTSTGSKPGKHRNCSEKTYIRTASRIRRSLRSQTAQIYLRRRCSMSFSSRSIQGRATSGIRRGRRRNCIRWARHRALVNRRYEAEAPAETRCLNHWSSCDASVLYSWTLQTRLTSK